MTFKELVSKLLDLDGRRLAIEQAAEDLEFEYTAGDIGEAQKELRSERLNDMVVPENAILLAAEELRKRAEELKVELDKMERFLLAHGDELEKQMEATAEDEERVDDEVPEPPVEQAPCEEPATPHSFRVVSGSGRSA